MPSQPQPSVSGIVVTDSGERQIPESRRADGSTRKAIKVRPGYQPPEDVAKFRIKGQQDPGRPRVIPGAEMDKESQPDATAASNKNAKRREARKKAKDAAAAAEKAAGPPPEPIDPGLEREKKARGLKKKLRQARELQSKKDGGDSLLPEQLEKVIRINQLVQELSALGIDAGDGQKPQPSEDAKSAAAPS